MLTVKAALPLLLMTSVAEFDDPTGQLEKLSAAGTLMTREAKGVPVPLARIALLPEVASEPTVMLLLKSWALVGANVTVMLVDAPGARPMVPFVQLPRKPWGYEMLVTLSVALPEFEIVSGRFVDCPTVRPPKARLPRRFITRVGATVPAPLTAMVLVPTVALELTVIFPL